MLIEFMKDKKNVHVTVGKHFRYPSVIWRVVAPKPFNCNPIGDECSEVSTPEHILMTTLEVKWVKDVCRYQTVGKVFATNPYSRDSHCILTIGVNYHEEVRIEDLNETFNCELRRVLDGSV